MLRKLEKYDILEEIGHGGMATVYRARDTRLDRMVALKVMHPHLRAAGEARARFAREARTVARLKHPNILEIYDYSGEESAESYIATELLTGPTLKRFAEDHASIPAEIAACFCIEVLRALGAAHEAGIVHRDVKPENVLLNHDEHVKLTDFGIAQMVDAQSMTATGQILGSPGHMAPEQIEGKDSDGRSDLFSLGTVLYYLATGKLPFSGRNPHQVLKKIIDGDYADPLRVRPTIGGRLRAIIQRSLETDVAKRYQDAASFEADLTKLVAQIGIDEPTVTLVRYLKDPDGVSDELRRKTITVLTDAGERAAGAGDIPTALDHWNRVLALDEGNERVLALIAKVGRGARRKAFAIGAAAGLALLTVGAIGYALVAPAMRGTRLRLARDPVVATARADAGAKIAKRPAPRRDAGLLQAKIARPLRVRLQPARVPVPPASAQRLVVLNPTPQGVAIGVDGAEPRAFGPSFQSIMLSPGRHHFRFIGREECCVDQDVDVTIPPGSTPFSLRQRLEFKRARLYVLSNVPANVLVDNGIASGRTRSIIEVPVRQRIEPHTITVTAPGYRAYTGQVRLTAGKVMQPPITLEREEGVPSPGSQTPTKAPEPERPEGSE